MQIETVTLGMLRVYLRISEHEFNPNVLLKECDL